MIDEVRTLTAQYHSWLRDKTELRDLDDWIEITCPYLDRHNDYIQIYVRRSNGGFLLTDDGYTISDLDISGCNLDTPKRQQLLKITLNGFGVTLNENSLQVTAAPNNFALKKHNLVQAMLAVNDLFYLATPVTRSLFQEDVVSWLDVSMIRYTPNVKLAGKSGYDHFFGFVIPKSTESPERILSSINKPDRTNFERTAFAWEDTKETRSGGSCAYVILNDTDRKISSNLLSAYQNCDINTILWSERESVLEELAA